MNDGENKGSVNDGTPGVDAYSTPWRYFLAFLALI